MSTPVGLLRRWRLYRRWGKRDGWTGNNAHDVTVSQVGDDRWFAEGWSLCRCGKDWHVTVGGSDEEMVRLRIELAGELCRACQAWVNRRLDLCPDGNCTLSYDHKGRCVPLAVSPRYLAEVEP